MKTQLKKSILATYISLFGAASFIVPIYSFANTTENVAPDTYKNTLKSMSYKVTSPKTVEIVFTFAEKPVAPKAYQIEKPARLVLDFSSTAIQASDKFMKVNKSIITNVVATDNQAMTRFIINLSELGDYTSKIDGNNFILKVTKKPEKVNYAPALPAPTLENTNEYNADAVTTAQANSALNKKKSKQVIVSEGVSSVITAPKKASSASVLSTRIGDVSFKRGQDNEGQVLVNLMDINTPVDVKQQGSKIIVKFLGSRVPDHLIRRLGVEDFSTPIKTIESYNDGQNGTVVISTQTNYEFYTLKTDNNVILGVKPVIEEKAKVTHNDTFKGKKISLEFQDIEVRYVLQMLADFNNFNLVASDSVKGNISIQLKDVPWDQALDIILKSKNLDKRKTGNVLMVAPADEISAREKQELQTIKQTEQLLPLQTDYIRLSYTKAEDLRKVITTTNPSGTSGGGSSNGDVGAASMLSARGKIMLDSRTNTLVIQDTSQRVDAIRDLVEKLDVPVRQVMIEARIVRASDNFSKELGVKWGVLTDGVVGNKNMLVGGSDSTLWNLRKPTQDAVTGLTYTIERPQNLSVDLGVASAAASRIAFGLLKLSDVMLDLELSALQSDGRGEIVATPKVLTADKQKARIASGTQIPYQQATSSGATSIQFINAELSLEVTPNITPDGKVGLELLVNSDTPGEVQASGVRAIDTNRVATNVLVEDGQTVVLGGIFQNQLSSSMLKTPFLGDIPYVGRVFRKEAKTNSKQELLIFVTPKLMSRVATTM